VLRLEFERPADHLDPERSACVDGAAPVLVAPDKEGASAVAEVQLGDLDARGLDMVYEATLSRVVVRESSVQLVLPLMAAALAVLRVGHDGALLADRVSRRAA
jgi:hypothetical protein